MTIDVSIVVPCHNEALYLDRFISKLISCIQRSALNVETIFVENGSTDDTLRRLTILKKRYHSITVFALPQADFGAAVKKGVMEARGRYVVIYNVDFWDERLLILTKVDLLGYDMVTCSKNLPSSTDTRTLPRQILTKLYNIILKTVFSFHGTDTTGIRVARRKPLQDIVSQSLSKTGVFDSEISIRGEKLGLSVLELPIIVREIRPSRFPSGRLITTIKDLFWFYKDLYMHPSFQNSSRVNHSP